MTPRNSYLEYKRDTSKILYWIIHTSNSIIKAMPEVETGDGDEGALKLAPFSLCLHSRSKMMSVCASWPIS
jgi:hypothetical protein